MSKKFRCGRLLLTRDGRVKKVELGGGGGTRTCDCSDEQMTFDDVHNLLLTIYSLPDQKQQTVLYDFQLQPLDVKKFKTLANYMDKYRFNRNSTIVYLCTSEVKIDPPPEIKIESEADNTNSNSLSVVKSEPAEESIAESTPPTTEYSFVHAINEMLKIIRELIAQNSSEKVLTKLFENLCLINGYVFSIIVPLQQQSNETEATLYLNNLNNIYDIFVSTNSLIHGSIEKFRHLKAYVTLRTSFFQFYNNVRIIRNRWMKVMKNSNVSDIKPKPKENDRRSSVKLLTSDLPSAIDEITKIQLKTFRPALDAFRTLLRKTANVATLAGFHLFVTESLNKTKNIRERIDLSSVTSVVDGKKEIMNVTKQFSKKLRAEKNTFSKLRSRRSILNAAKAVLRKMRSLGTTIYRVQIRKQEDSPIDESTTN
ncbi:unnamed protein product [Adineta ricciae]|uniref:Uncharacterized protein n=1 Tax=Adineta ricciae TaxID=249248 RepID=A0A815H8Q3_ADIRI|nr:unnamed protein product [Adineta ricciae]CAF1349032.1 unnamed protein product [Adineta ricciae]